MNLINREMAKTITNLVSAGTIEASVTKAWQKNSSCLKNLNNKNKHELEKIDLKLLKGLFWKGTAATELFKVMKASLKAGADVTVQEKEFAQFLYDNYPKHSIKALGFY